MSEKITLLVQTGLPWNFWELLPNIEDQGRKRGGGVKTFSPQKNFFSKLFSAGITLLRQCFCNDSMNKESQHMLVVRLVCVLLVDKNSLLSARGRNFQGLNRFCVGIHLVQGRSAQFGTRCRTHSTYE